MFLEPLQELKTRDPIFIDRDDFAVEDGRPRLQFRNRVSDRWEFGLQRKAVAGPEVRLARRIEHRDRPVTIELDFEDPIR